MIDPVLPSRVGVVICAVDAAAVIAPTIRAARAIPAVDLVLVVDDGSSDETGATARGAGAIVVRHSHNRGRAVAMETGSAVVAMRDLPHDPPRALLFLDAGLGDCAVHCAGLVTPVLAGEADLTTALVAAGVARSVAATHARRAIRKLTGKSVRQPLSHMRCMTREAFEAAAPLARGAGLEVGMTIDILAAGFALREIPADFTSCSSSKANGLAQARDVAFAVQARWLRRIGSAAKHTLQRRK